MGELDEKLNAILGDPDAMGQIMALARSFGGEEQKENKSSDDVPEAQQEDVLSVLGSMDPRMLQLGMQAIRTFQQEDDKRTALLSALRPFLKETRRNNLDRAIQLTKMSKVLRLVADAVREGGEPLV